MTTAQTADFFGGGDITAPNVAAAHDPNDDPNPNNPGGISNNELARQKNQALTQQQTSDQQSIIGAPFQRQTGDSMQKNIDPNTGTYYTGMERPSAPGSLGTDLLSLGSTLGGVALNPLGSLASLATGSPYAKILGGPGAIGQYALNQVAGGVNQSVQNAPSTGGTPGSATPIGGVPGGTTAASLGSEPYAGNPVVQNDQSTANSLASQVQNTQPTTNPATDPTAANMQALTPVVDPALAQSPETATALAQSQDLVNRILNQPLQSQILGDQALSNSLAQARSARGGAGAVQNAEDAARNQAPALLQQASQSATQEQVQRAGAAGQAASIYAGVATNDANRAVNIATANQGAGLSVLNNLTALTGQQLTFDANKMQAIGQLARDYFANSAAFAQMDVTQQVAQWDNLVKTYQIDKTFDAAVQAIRASKNIGPLDALKLLLGAGEAAGTTAAALA